MGGLPTPPLLSRGQHFSVGENWPTSRRSGYVTLVWGTKSEVAHKWADWLHYPCQLGVTDASVRGKKSQVAHEWADWLYIPCHLGAPNASQR